MNPDSTTTEARYPSVPSWMVLAFCVYVVSWYLQVGTRYDFLRAIRFEYVLASTLVVLALYRWISAGTGGANNRRLIGWAVALVAVLGLHVVFSIDAEHSWYMYVERVIKFSFFGIFAATFVKSPKHLRWVLCALFIAWLKMGQEGLLGHITGGLIWQNQGIMRLHGATGAYSHPNSFAGWAIGTLPFVYYLFPVVKSRIARWLLILQAALSIHVVIFAGSRTAYVGLFALMMYVIWHSRHRVRATVAVALLLGVAAFIVPDSYTERARSIVTLEEAEGDSSGARLLILQDAWEILKAEPLGVGVAGFPTARWERFGRFQDTHNLYLQVATNIGIHGLVVFVGFLTVLLMTLRRIARSARIAIERSDGDANSGLREDLGVVAATASAVEAFVILRLVLGLFGMDLYEVYWWLALGFAVSLSNIAYHARSGGRGLALPEST